MALEFNKNFVKKYLGVILAVVILFPSLVWVWLDKSLWWWDQSWYGEVALNIASGFGRGVQSGIHEMMIAFHIKAPLIAWLEALFVPLGVALKHINATFLTVLLATQGAALVLFYKILLKVTKNIFGAALGVLALGSAPLFLALAHQNFVEPLQIFVVVWFIYIALEAPQWTRPKIALHLVAAVTIGFMAKISTPVFVVVPGVYAAWWFFATKQKMAFTAYVKKPLNVIALIAVIILGIFSAVWYGKNFQEITTFALSTSSGSIAQLFGTHANFVQKIGFWVTQLGTVFFTPFSIVIAPFLFIGALMGLIDWKPKKQRWQDYTTPNLTAISIMSLIVVILVFSFQVNSLSRFLVPTFPYLAALMAIAATKTPTRILRAIILVGFILQAIVLNAFTLNLLPYHYNVSYVDFLAPFEKENTTAQHITNIISATCNDTTASKIMIFGIDAAILNANAASYVAAKTAAASHTPACKYSTIGFAQTSEEAAWKRFSEFQSPYYITLDPIKYPQFYGGSFNAVSLNILSRVQKDPHFVKVSFPDSDTFIYKNTQYIK